MSHVARRLISIPLWLFVLVGPLTVGAVDPGKPSVTALETTAYRAIGARHPNPAFRNDDVLAERFLGKDERAILKKAGSTSVLAGLQKDTESAWKSLGPFSTAVHVRTRHIDAVFREALTSGATQAVILGAGLDSRAYRFGDLLRQVRVFEVDFPPTQEYKKARVRQVVGSLPRHVSFVGIDFTKDDLASVLKRAGYDATQKTVFVWEGVTFYIPEAAVISTLGFVATNSAPGSRIVFDYFLATTLKTPANLALNKRLSGYGEPFIFGIPDEARDQFVARQGLAVVTDIGINDLRARYMPPGTYDPAARSGGYVCTAAVPASSAALSLPPSPSRRTLWRAGAL